MVSGILHQKQTTFHLILNIIFIVESTDHTSNDTEIRLKNVKRAYIPKYSQTHRVTSGMGGELNLELSENNY